MSYRTPEEVAINDFPVLWKASRQSSGEFFDVLTSIIRERDKDTLEEYKRRLMCLGGGTPHVPILDEMLAELEPKPKELQSVKLRDIPPDKPFIRSDGRFKDSGMIAKWRDHTCPPRTRVVWDKEGREFHWPCDMLVVPVEDKP